RSPDVAASRTSTSPLTRTATNCSTLSARLRPAPSCLATAKKTRATGSSNKFVAVGRRSRSFNPVRERAWKSDPVGQKPSGSGNKVTLFLCLFKPRWLRRKRAGDLPSWPRRQRQDASLPGGDPLRTAEISGGPAVGAACAQTGDVSTRAAVVGRRSAGRLHAVAYPVF